MSEEKSSAPSDAQQKMVTLTIDGQEVTVPEGTNVIEAAKTIGVEIPHYCYHPHLSVAGNCRMCQCNVEGRRKLEIACNTPVGEGMVVQTQETNDEVANAQRATLEFLLINHPLDCTVCDQAGHCKLQDYYYEYNGKPSRFIEEKVNKVKAEPLGSEIVYDGERCILCTRCVRFCDEISETSELGVLNRGDKSVIAIHEGKPLENPLSGSVVDLCPVGALTHTRWRFNSRIWYTKEVDTVCAGCSTGCNAKVSVRDGEVVQVKARLNSDVNEEWMCNEGRYGFDRFQPELRLTDAVINNEGNLTAVPLQDAISAAADISKEDSPAIVFLSPFLTLEELWASLKYAREVLGVDDSDIAVAVAKRQLSKEEAVLVSPDYAPNARGVSVLGLGGIVEDWRGGFEAHYASLLNRVRSQDVSRVVIIGQRAVLDEHCDEKFIQGLEQAKSILITPHAVPTNGSAHGSLHRACSVVLPSQTVNEKSGVFVNQNVRIQRLQALLTPPFGSLPEWSLVSKIAEAAGTTIVPASVVDERSLFRAMVSDVPELVGLTLAKIGSQGIPLSHVSSFRQKTSDPVPQENTQA